MKKKSIILTAIAFLLTLTLQAQEQQANEQSSSIKRVSNRRYTPDPAPVVSGDRLYVFTGHDLDTATYFRMPDWQVFSTTDMEHWTDHGIVLTTAHFKWAKQGDNAWASQAIERNGKWYWYVAAEDTTKHLHGIGVAVADRPEGPWADALGKPLIPGGWGFIDPTVFIDDDGQAWLFWGNNGCWYAKLNEDMISIDKSFANNGICDMRAMLDDEAQFGPKCMKMDYQLHRRVMKTGFEEAPTRRQRVFTDLGTTKVASPTSLQVPSPSTEAPSTSRANPISSITMASALEAMVSVAPPPSASFRDRRTVVFRK